MINGLTTTNACNIPGIGSPGSIWQQPYPYPTYTYPTVTTIAYQVIDRDFPFQIRKTENGFILKKDSKEFCFESVESLLKYLESNLG